MARPTSIARRGVTPVCARSGSGNRSRPPVNGARRERALLSAPPSAATVETITINNTNTVQRSPPPLAGLEETFKEIFFGQPSARGDWEEIGGCWVLKPLPGIQAQAIVHFVGDAFVGAAPQLAYRQFLEALAEKGVVVVCTPYSTTFDHLRAADEAQTKFDDAITALGPYVGQLPVYGVGHSLGSLIHLLISSRFSVKREGNALMSFSNKPAREVIPLVTQLSPAARMFGPLLSQLAASPLRPTAEMIQEALRGLSPSVLRQVVPLFEQFAPMYMDAAQGREEFSPNPQETRDRIKSFYDVRRNLLIKFTDDTIDESEQLASMLQASGIGSVLDMTVRTLPGQHNRPMTQALVDLPPPVARMANRACLSGGKLIDDLSKSFAGPDELSTPQLDKLSKSVSGMASLFGTQSGGPVTSSIVGLADEVAAWMGIEQPVPRSLPSTAARQAR